MKLSQELKNSYVAIATFVVKGHFVDEFLAMFSALLPKSAEELGFVRFEIFRSIADPNAFTVVDLFRDEDAYQQHIAKPYLSRFVEDTKDFYAGAPQVTFCEMYGGIQWKI